MAPRRSKNLKTKEVKIPHFMISNRKKMETWGVGGSLQLIGVALMITWWRKVYNLPKASPRAITNSDAPTPDWGEIVKKTVARQIKGLGVCYEATCLSPYLAHLYGHFHEMDPKEKESSKKRKASIQTVSTPIPKSSRRKRRNQKRRFLVCFVRAKLIEVSPLT
ncbi:hypothetical protein R1flu_011600 [Riccia fluitans]|uniref:Uncharacterized protein n=1 Tax=Riccia fluitans TaxID=41844 RepID=A0ABD1Z9D7_9MARC